MAQGRLSWHPHWKQLAHSMLEADNHSFIVGIFNIMYNPQINNGYQDIVTIKHFSSSIFDPSSVLAQTKIAT